MNLLKRHDIVEYLMNFDIVTILETWVIDSSYSIPLSGLTCLNVLQNRLTGRVEIWEA